MLDFTIYTADCVGNSGNCLYPNNQIVFRLTAIMTIQITRTIG